ncbi:MAG: hypothetical protein P8P98_00140 [Emcibacteraceae bacterium]|nr:hypothetical protein [Emcibacteraceae bacterium]
MGEVGESISAENARMILSTLPRYFCALVLTCFLSEVAAGQVNYHVTIKQETPTRADVSMMISGPASARVLYSRSGDLQTKTQVCNVSCDGNIIRQNYKKEWNIPRNCAQVNWQVDFVIEDEQGIAAYEQKSALMGSGKWWVFSSPSALLRLKREPSNLKISFDVPFGESFEAKLPTKNRPPEYFALGSVQKQTVRRAGIKLTYISDNPS